MQTKRNRTKFEYMTPKFKHMAPISIVCYSPNSNIWCRSLTPNSNRSMFVPSKPSRRGKLPTPPVPNNHTSVFCYAATQLARPLHQERTQVVCSNNVARNRLARKNSRNGPWKHECCFEVDVFVCWECIEKWLLLLRICGSFFVGFRRPNLSTRLI